MHGEAVEDAGGHGVVAEVAPPLPQIDIGRDGGGELAVPAIDEIEEGMRGGGPRRRATADLAEADIIDDEQVGACPRPSPSRKGWVLSSQAGVEVVEQIDGAGVAQGDALDARAQAEGLEEVALSCAGLARDDEVVVDVE